MTFSKHLAEDHVSHERAEVRARARRRASFIGDIKNTLKLQINEQDLSITKLASLMKVSKSAISKHLNPDTNIEAFTLFDLAEALGCEWSFSLEKRRAPKEAQNARVWLTHTINKNLENYRGLYAELPKEVFEGNLPTDRRSRSNAKKVTRSQWYVQSKVLNKSLNNYWNTIKPNYQKMG